MNIFLFSFFRFKILLSYFSFFQILHRVLLYKKYLQKQHKTMKQETLYRYLLGKLRNLLQHLNLFAFSLTIRKNIKSTFLTSPYNA